MPHPNLHTTCCIIGGGPAGVMLGFLLARDGINVTVLEKHRDFFRDFRGDTVHPSTLQLLDELGILDDFLVIPHQQVDSVTATVGSFSFRAATFRHLPTRCKFVALMPQWDFLNFLSEKARQFPGFDLRMQHEATGLTRHGAAITGVVTGVDVQTPDGPIQISADLVIGCDGRHSTTRPAAQLAIQEFGVPIDVLWFRISRSGNDPEQLFGNINFGKLLILINRGDYFQAGLIIRKDAFAGIKQAGLQAFRRTITAITPYLSGRVHEIEDWKQVQLLSVQINRLRQWHRPGVLCIGDAAHAMSPAGGVGINLAIQDAVATARILSEALRARSVTEQVLAAIQRRREFPTVVTQQLQINAHKMFARVFQNPGPLEPPPVLKAIVRIPGLQRFMGRVVGLGVRPEHIRPQAQSPNKLKPILQIAAILAVVALTARVLIRRTPSAS